MINHSGNCILDNDDIESPLCKNCFERLKTKNNDLLSKFQFRSLKVKHPSLSIDRDTFLFNDTKSKVKYLLDEME